MCCCHLRRKFTLAALNHSKSQFSQRLVSKTLKLLKLVTLKPKRGPYNISIFQLRQQRLACALCLRLGGCGVSRQCQRGITGGTGALEVLVLQRSSSQCTHRPPLCCDWSLSLADLYSSLLKLLYKAAEIPGDVERERESGKHIRRGMK